MAKFESWQELNLKSEEFGESTLTIISLVDPKKSFGFLGQCYHVKERTLEGRLVMDRKMMSESEIDNILREGLEPKGTRY